MDNLTIRAEETGGRRNAELFILLTEHKSRAKVLRKAQVLRKEKVSRKAKAERSMIKTIRDQNMKLLGHIMRKEDLRTAVCGGESKEEAEKDRG